MNSACAVVASHAIGAVPYLLTDGKNGFVYKDGNIEDLYAKTKWLIDNKEKRREIAKNAYFTMVNEWNAERATGKIIKLAEGIMEGKKMTTFFKEGVCSKAELFREGWYK
jgi:glycosyltransferase involved in cell wall biosynthesis